MCKDAGIPVVYINREPDAEREQAWVDDGIKATYVGADARQSGTYQGEEIAELENKGDADGDGVVRYIMVQGDPENVDAQYRTEKSVGIRQRVRRSLLTLCPSTATRSMLYSATTMLWLLVLCRLSRQLEEL